MDYNKYYLGEDEKPLDNLTENGGLTSIFRTIACIGDSLSSGEFAIKMEDGKNTYHDMFEYSWGQYIARMAGCKVFNFSAGGMDAERYIKEFADIKGYWGDDKKAQCYIIALGVNDATRVMDGEAEFGTMDDFCQDGKNPKDTFVGYYSAIIARYKSISPNAKFFLMTCPKTQYEEKRRTEIYDMHQKVLNELAQRFTNTYVIDLRTYAPLYDEKFASHFYLNGHLTPAGYKITADMVSSYIDYIVRKYPRDFIGVGLINTPNEYKIKLMK